MQKTNPDLNDYDNNDIKYVGTEDKESDNLPIIKWGYETTTRKIKMKLIRRGPQPLNIILEDLII